MAATAIIITATTEDKNKGAMATVSISYLKAKVFLKVPSRFPNMAIFVYLYFHGHASLSVPSFSSLDSGMTRQRRMRTGVKLASQQSLPQLAGRACAQVCMYTCMCLCVHVRIQRHTHPPLLCLGKPSSSCKASLKS